MLPEKSWEEKRFLTAGLFDGALLGSPPFGGGVCYISNDQSGRLVVASQRAITVLCCSEMLKMQLDSMGSSSVGCAVRIGLKDADLFDVTNNLEKCNQ